MVVYVGKEKFQLPDMVDVGVLGKDVKNLEKYEKCVTISGG